MEGQHKCSGTWKPFGDLAPWVLTQIELFGTLENSLHFLSDASFHLYCRTVISGSKPWACLSAALEFPEQISVETFPLSFEGGSFHQGNLSTIYHTLSVSHILGIIHHWDVWGEGTRQ